MRIHLPIQPWRTRSRRWAAAGAGGILTLAALGGCATNPATGKMDLAPAISPSQQVQVGLQAAPQFVQEGGGELANPEVQQYVQSVGARVVAAIPADLKKDYQFSFHVLNSDDINAFALPGGPIFITRGILQKMSNEAELAFILGHESGHVVAQHVARQMTQSSLLQSGLQLASSLGGDNPSTTAQLSLLGGQFAAQLYQLRYSRGDESEADTLGLRFMVAAGYDPAGAVNAMQVLDQVGGSSTVQFFSTHPNPGNRVQALEDQIKKEFPQAYQNPKYATNQPAYQQHILAQLPGSQPVNVTTPSLGAPAK
jgi:predicted Zn-dependent protease